MPVTEQESTFFQVSLGDLDNPAALNRILRFISGELSYIEDRLRVLEVPAVAGVVTTTGGVTYLSEWTLTVATTNITSPATPNSGDRLTVILTQDPTGGRQITWSADFMLAGVDIIPDAGTVSVFNFIGRADSKWWMSSMPITGITP